MMRKWELGRQRTAGFVLHLTVFGRLLLIILLLKRPILSLVFGKIFESVILKP